MRIFQKKVFLSILDNEQNFFCYKSYFLHVPRNILTKVFWGNCIYFLSIFFFWANFFSILSEYFEQGCRNWNLRVDTKPLNKIKFFEKIVGVFIFFRKEQKPFKLLTKTFWQGCEYCFRCGHRMILRSFFLHHELTLFDVQSKIFH